MDKKVIFAEEERLRTDPATILDTWLKLGETASEVQRLLSDSNFLSELESLGVVPEILELQNIEIANINHLIAMIDHIQTFPNSDDIRGVLQNRYLKSIPILNFGFS